VNEVVWVTPLLLLPGVALLVVSTANRFSTLHDEMHHWLGHDGPIDRRLVASLAGRGRRIRNALLALYSAIGLLALGGLVGGSLSLLDVSAEVPVTALTALGILLTCFAAVQLISETRLLLRVLELHAGELQKRT
jgi:hypothetical protein